MNIVQVFVLVVAVSGIVLQGCEKKNASSRIAAGQAENTAATSTASVFQAATDTKANSSADILFEFAFSRSKESLFIRITDVKGAKKTPGWFDDDWAAVVYRTSGEEVPKDVPIFKMVPERIYEVVTNRMTDAYTAILGEKAIKLSTEGFYYNVSDGGCGGDTVTIKLVPDHGTGNIDLQAQDIVILKQPHPALSTLKVTAFERYPMKKEWEGQFLPKVQEKFKQTSAEGSFTRGPFINYFKSKDGNSDEYLAAWWESDRTEGPRCLAGLYKIERRGSDLILVDVISLGSEPGLYQPELQKFVEIGGKKFAFVAGGSGTIVFEIAPGQDVWKRNSGSRPEVSC